MKLILYVTASVIVFTIQLIAQSGWYSQTPKPTGDNLNSVFYLNSTIWAVGGSSSLIKSNDNGSTWENKQIGFNYILSGVQYVDQFNGVVLGEEVEYIPGNQTNVFGVILTTTDGGNSWSLKYRDLIKPHCVFFIDKYNGWAVADSGKVFKTTDSGNSWTEYYCGYNTSLQEVEFLDSQNGWAIGDGIFKTTNGGINWEEVSSINDYFDHMYFLNINLGWVCGTEIYKTTDGGHNWIQLTNVGYGIWYDIQFIDQDNGWCISYNFSLETNEILKSTDGGVTWTVQYSSSYMYPKGLHFVNTNDGVSVGQYGAILTTSNSGNNWDLKTEWIPIALQKVHFPSVNTGFTIGRKGSGSYTTFTYFTLKSTDGGTNWSISDSLPNSWFKDLFFINDTKGWIVGGNFADTTGIIRYTGDGGTNWVTQYSSTSDLITSVYFIDEFNGWATKSNGNLLHTTDGGNVWLIQTTGFPFYYEKIFFINSSTGWVIGGSNISIIKTTDGGSTWQDVSPPNQLDVPYDIDFVNAQVGWVVGAHGTLLKTTDGGLTWNQSWPEPWPQGPTFQSVDFANENVGWIVTDEIDYPLSGSYSSIFYTTDGGNNWNLQAYLNGRTGSIFFLDEQTGWFVSGNYETTQPKIGYVYKTTTGGITFIEDDNEINLISTSFHLKQNYPNPFNPSTKIRWQLPVGSWQTIKVYDVLGNEVATLVDEYKAAGSYEVEWNASGLPSGIYFYQLKTENFMETKKMILMK